MLDHGARVDIAYEVRAPPLVASVARRAREMERAPGAGGGARRGAPALPKGSWPWMLAEALENRTFGEDSDGGGGDGARGAARDAVLDARGDDGARAAPSVLELRHAMGCDDAMMADRERVWEKRRRENAQRRRRRP